MSRKRRRSGFRSVATTGTPSSSSSRTAHAPMQPPAPVTRNLSVGVGMGQTFTWRAITRNSLGA